MKKILAFTLALILIFPSWISWGATDEGYGEDSESLGQFVDSFETSDNVSITYNVIRNATFEAMELNYTIGDSGFYEDFEANNLNNWDVTVGATTGAGYKKTGVFGARVWSNPGLLEKNFPAIAPDAVSVWIQPKIYRCYFNWKDSGASQTSMGIYHRADTNTWYHSGTNNVIAAGCAENLWYNIYFDDIDFVAFTFDVKIYDSAMFLKGSGNNLVFQNNFDHFDFIRIQAGTSTTGQLWLDDFNVSLGIASGYDTEGYFTTVDYLDDPLANGSALVALMNTTIPANTQILVEFSEDNITWVFNDWQPLFGGFEAVDLRDLNYSTGYHCRFNLSTTDQAVTPRVYQNRVITTIGAGGITVNQTINLINGTWERYNLTAIVSVVGTHDSGDVNSTFFIDSDEWNCSEVAGVPGYQINFNATGIDTEAISLYLEIWMYYDGTNNHVINVDLWNFTSTAWVTLGQIPDMLGYQWENYTVWGLHDPLHFLNATGAIVGRLYHVTNGNINDDISIEQFQVLAFVPTGLAVGGAGVQTNWGLLWFFLILICIPIALTLVKGSRR